MPREIDREALCDYFSCGYIPAPKTIYRAARKVRPGHYLVASNGNIREVCYWDLSFAAVENRTEEEWCELLRHAFCEPTRLQLLTNLHLRAFFTRSIHS